MNNKISLRGFIAAKHLLSRCTGYSLSEFLTTAAKTLPNECIPSITTEIHRTFVRLGYLSVMGHNRAYDGHTDPTYKWNSAPPASVYYTDLLIVCEINNNLKSPTTGDVLS